MVGPRADYECSRCAQTFELPVGASACPSCGKRKWFTRLFNAVNVSTGSARRKDRVLEPAYEQAHAAKNAAKEAEQARRIAPSLAVPIDQLPRVVAGFGGTAGDSSVRRGEVKPAGPNLLRRVLGNPSAPALSGPAPGPGSAGWAPKK